MDVTITNNSAEIYGGGLFCITSSPSLVDVTITNNSAEIYGGGLWFHTSFPSLANVTIANNSADSPGGGGGGIYYGVGSYLTLINSIIWNNTPHQIYITFSLPLINYSNISDGNWVGEGNINDDPLFVDSGTGDYTLQEGSPCIDAGTPFFVWEGDTLVNLEPDEYVGSAPDMGAYEYVGETFVNEPDELPQKVALYQNYPNPFNPITTIRYDLPENSHVTLMIYDLLGRQVISLVDELQQSGRKSVKWEAAALPTGVYIYRLTSNQGQISKKMLLLK